MGRATGIGGVFFKARDPQGLARWYRDHLGLPVGNGSSAVLPWGDGDRAGGGGLTVWALLPQETNYFEPSPATFMINYRVDDLDGLMEKLREDGVAVEDRREESEYGRFAWITDPEGNRVELWEPPK